jgi:hypothetical protein
MIEQHDRRFPSSAKQISSPPLTTATTTNTSRPTTTADQCMPRRTARKSNA